MSDADPHKASKPLPRTHRTRLRAIWRSAGWPCCDTVEIELLAAGLLHRVLDANGRDTLRLTDAGVAAIACDLQANRARRGEHEALVDRVALAQQRSGRIAWCGLSLRAPLVRTGGEVDWAVARPDVYSIRDTTVEAYVHPVAHEIKVTRADLLSDLRQPDKGAAYHALACECWYVLKAGIGRCEDVPDAFGVLIATADSLETARPAPHRSHRLSLSVWMALAKAVPRAAVREAEQAMLQADPSG